MYWCWWFLFFQSICLFFFVRSSSAELVTSLPGQPANVSFHQYSGYIVTDRSHGRALFYYFVEADAVDPQSRPLTLWLNGGPGCSSLGFGAFMEHGPFRPENGGLLIQNKYSWNLESNMLYVESPIGVGFSYSNTSSDYIDWNDARTAEENLRFIVNWLEEFPKYKDSELYLTGESYAGHYIPQLVALMVEYNKQPKNRPIKLKAIALGNPLLDFDISVISGEYLWAHGAISDETFHLLRTVCNDSTYLREIIHGKSSKRCSDVFSRVNEETGYIDSGDLLLPLCLSARGMQQFISREKHEKIQAKLAQTNSVDPCLEERISAYLNQPQVQKALHANTSQLPFSWEFCSRTLAYQKDNLDMNLIPLVSNLLQEGIPVMLYSGDQDAKIPLTQTRIIANKLARELKLIPFTRYSTWHDGKQVGGWTQSFGGLKQGKNVTYLTYATVRGGAHEVPFTSPSQALSLFRAFLAGSPLPTA